MVKFNALEVPDLNTSLGKLTFAIFSCVNWMVTFSPYLISKRFWSEFYLSSLYGGNLKIKVI